MPPWTQANSYANWLRRLFQKYGLTEAQYNTLLVEQGSVCLLCQKPDPRGRLSVDHCHEHNRVRGLLCRKCNYVLGVIQDDPWWAYRAGEYLKGNEELHTSEDE